MAAPWLSGNLSEFIKEDPYFSSKSPLVVKDILSGALTLVKFVEQLDGVLTDLSPDIRKRGTQVLSDILQGLPTDFLTEEELNFISTFYSFRLKDQHEVLPAVFQGILAVCNMDNLPKTSPFNICSTLFLHVNCQSQLQSDRLAIYQIISLILTKHLENVRMMGPDFVYGVISALDGERDPRNLLYIFNMFPNFVRSMPPLHLTEEAFEVMACYFPVDFNPTSQDPNGITREDLSGALAPCLTAIPEFAEFCLPLLLEKLDAELRIGKLDSLRLLADASARFTVESLSTHLSAVWSSLSREALRNGDRETREAAQAGLMALLRRLAAEPLDSDAKQDQMRLLLGDALSACTPALAEVHTTLFLPSSQLLVAAARACSATCYIVCKKVLPLVLSYFQEKNEPTEKVVLLQTMTILLTAAHSLQVTPKDFPELASDWNSISEVYLRSCQDSDRGLQQEALEGLTVLMPSLKQEHVSDLSKKLLGLIDSEESFDTRDTMYACLLKMANLYPDEVQSSIVNVSMSREGCSERSFERRMLAMCRLATVEKFTLPILTQVIPSVVTATCDFSKVKARLDGLRNLLDAVDKDGETRERLHRHLVQCDVVQSIGHWWIAGMAVDPVPSIFCDSSVLETSALILAQVTCHQTAEEQQRNLSVLPGFFSTQNFAPLNPDSPLHQTRTVSLLESILGTLRPSVEIPETLEVFHKIFNLGLKTNDDITRCSALRLCASIVNKSGHEETLNSMLSLATNEISSCLANPNSTVRIKGTAALAWIVKALVMRGYKDSEVWTNKIIELLAVPSSGETRLDDDVGQENVYFGAAVLASSVGLQAASAFKLVMQDSPVFLNAHCHCHVKLLYKQRFFQVTPLLASAFTSAPENVRTHYLVALAYLLQGVPKAVLTSNLPQIIPLLLESLAKRETLLLLAVLNTLESLVPEKMHHEVLSSHLQTMLPRLLPLTVPPLPMKVRIAALRCLKELCSFSLPLILPYKEEVVNDLKTCLNDPKRLVRKEAVETRSRWILCDALDIN